MLKPGKRALPCVLACGLIALVFSAWKFKVTGQPPFLHRENVWSVAMYAGNSPLEMEPILSPDARALTAADVSDIDALFVADPFMVQDGEVWYLFVEVLNRDTTQGDIAVALSQDQGVTWEYQRSVLDEPWHLSYPSVFKWNERWYMLPQGDTGVHLYEAESFPHSWRCVTTLLDGNDLADPTVFQYDDSWWMFVGRSGSHDRLQLYYSDEIEGPWLEHPSSPIVSGNPDIARPGGKVVQFDGHLYRFAQDCAPKYGNQLRGFRIIDLTRHTYKETPIVDEFVLRAGSADWNSNGMHHIDAHRKADGTWWAAVDGHKKTWILSWKP